MKEVFGHNDYIWEHLTKEHLHWYNCGQ